MTPAAQRKAVIDREAWLAGVPEVRKAKWREELLIARAFVIAVVCVAMLSLLWVVLPA